MSTSEQNQLRRTLESENLAALERESSILHCRLEGTPPHRMLWSFHGRGWVPDESSGGVPRVAERHDVEMVFPFAFPEQPPELKFLTPIFHPAVSSSGTLNVADCGLEWDSKLGCDVLCERIWDLIRGAAVPENVDQQNAARRWFDAVGQGERIVDSRPLRDRPEKPVSNIIKYRRKTTVYATPEPPRKRGRSEAPPVIPAGDRSRTTLDRRPMVGGEPGIVFLNEPTKMRNAIPSADASEIVFLDEGS